jgi:excisionase family DNA binding protein
MIIDKLLTVREVADRLGLKEATIRRMILQRRIDTVRPSVRAVRVPESAIRAILEKGYRPALLPQGKSSAS